MPLPSDKRQQRASGVEAKGGAPAAAEAGTPEALALAEAAEGKGSGESGFGVLAVSTPLAAANAAVVELAAATAAVLAVLSLVRGGCRAHRG
jgi:hypothetical protein